MGMSEAQLVKETAQVHALPFVKLVPQGTRRPKPVFWCVQPTGDYEADCHTGKAYAMALMELDSFRVTSVFTQAVKAMPRGDELTGIEVAFLTHVAKLAAW